jgi:hypothetical protein
LQKSFEVQLQTTISDCLTKELIKAKNDSKTLESKTRKAVCSDLCKLVNKAIKNGLIKTNYDYNFSKQKFDPLMLTVPINVLNDIIKEIKR